MFVGTIHSRVLSDRRCPQTPTEHGERCIVSVTGNHCFFFRASKTVRGSVLYWLLERCQYSILVAFASILKILQYPGGCQYTGSGGQYTGSGCLTYCHYMAVRLVLLQCFGVLH